MTARLVVFTASNEFVIINFYAEWCRFSNMLQPIFDEAADKIKEHFPDSGRVLFAKVDCDKESKLLPAELAIISSTWEVHSCTI